LWLALLPASGVYGAAVQLRNFLFAQGVLSSARLPRPVVSVGNLTVGGTGKTPTCLWLAQELTTRGLKVAILSRGYGRKETKPVVLRPTEGAAMGISHEKRLKDAGDEPLMLAEIYGQTVGIAADRATAAAALLRHQDVDVFLLDDGFQHRQIQRDVDLLLLGADSAGSLLPAGPFREPRGNLCRADFLLTTDGDGAWAPVVSKQNAAKCFAASLRPVGLVGINSDGSKEFPLALLCRSKILTVTAIADPRGVYRFIHEWEGEIVETLEFPDHHTYTARDWQKISRLARLVDLIITSEKDILKLNHFPFARDKLLALRVALQVENGDALIEAILKKIGDAQLPGA
jgi:tetraacyldisaccharide 4'-kinase